MESLAEATFKAGLLAAVPRLRGFARALTGNQAMGDDLAQDTVLRAWRGRDGFEPGTKMEAWLFRILRNAHISGLRSRARFQVRDLEDVEDSLTATDDPSARMALDDVRRALDLLPLAQREAVMLVGAAGWSYEEAARHAGCPIGTLKSRVFRARKLLADHLEAGDMRRDAIHPSDAAARLMKWASDAEASVGGTEPRSFRSGCRDGPG